MRPAAGCALPESGGELFDGFFQCRSDRVLGKSSRHTAGVQSLAERSLDDWQVDGHQRSKPVGQPIDIAPAELQRSTINAYITRDANHEAGWHEITSILTHRRNNQRDWTGSGNRPGHS
ncbi:MAG: hypothetical protein ACR2IK_12870 [Chloroflexota bacterium]